MSKAQGIAQSANQGQFKNRIINGDCRIDQRNNGASVTPTATTYTLDRWHISINNSSKLSVQQSSTAPTGFNNSVLLTSLAATTVGATDYYQLRHRVEGYNVADLGFGTANASTITVSFWVRSSLTGTFSLSLINEAENRFYPTTYTINSANTWEQKTITIAGDTSGTWAKTNGTGLFLNFVLGLGSAYTTSTTNSWGSNGYGVSSTTNFVSTNGATLYITGVQLEKGSTATSFDYRPYGTELALCQRYYGRFQSTGIVTSASFGTGIANSTSQGAITIQFPQTMRSSPTISQSQTAITDSSTYDSNVSAIAAQYTCTTNARLVLNTAGGMTQYRTGLLIAQSSTSGYVDFSAEL